MRNDLALARLVLERHQGGGPLLVEDEELLARWTRAATDPRVTVQERRVLRLEIDCHPVLAQLDSIP